MLPPQRPAPWLPPRHACCLDPAITASSVVTALVTSSRIALGSLSSLAALGRSLKPSITTAITSITATLPTLAATSSAVASPSPPRHHPTLLSGASVTTIAYAIFIVTVATAFLRRHLRRRRTVTSATASSIVSDIITAADSIVIHHRLRCRNLFHLCYLRFHRPHCLGCFISAFIISLCTTPKFSAARFTFFATSAITISIPNFERLRVLLPPQRHYRLRRLGRSSSVYPRPSASPASPLPVGVHVPPASVPLPFLSSPLSLHCQCASSLQLPSSPLSSLTSSILLAGALLRLLRICVFFVGRGSAGVLEQHVSAVQLAT